VGRCPGTEPPRKGTQRQNTKTEALIELEQQGCPGENLEQRLEQRPGVETGAGDRQRHRWELGQTGTGTWAWVRQNWSRDPVGPGQLNREPEQRLGRDLEWETETEGTGVGAWSRTGAGGNPGVGTPGNRT
jgi:hypothetical protein